MGVGARIAWERMEEVDADENRLTYIVSRYLVCNRGKCYTVRVIIYICMYGNHKITRHLNHLTRETLNCSNKAADCYRKQKRVDRVKGSTKFVIRYVVYEEYVILFVVLHTYVCRAGDSFGFVGRRIYHESREWAGTSRTSGASRKRKS